MHNLITVHCAECPSHTRAGKERRSDIKIQALTLRFLSLENLLNLFIPFTVLNNVVLYGIDNSNMTDAEEH